MMHELEEVRDSCANDNAASVMEFCRQHHLPMASHDDTLVEHVEEALSNGISISEFPTTTEAACCASENGMLVMMGAPNVVRGGSHSGNASALDVAKEGHLGEMCIRDRSRSGRARDGSPGHGARKDGGRSGDDGDRYAGPAAGAASQSHGRPRPRRPDGIRVSFA